MEKHRQAYSAFCSLYDAVFLERAQRHMKRTVKAVIFQRYSFTYIDSVFESAVADDIFRKTEKIITVSYWVNTYIEQRSPRCFGKKNTGIFRHHNSGKSVIDSNISNVPYLPALNPLFNGERNI